MKRWATAAVLMGSVLGARGAHAQAIQNVVLRNSFNPLGAGARGLGMGGAFIAVADDGTAASFNPAGLAQLRRTEFAAVGLRNHRGTWGSINRKIVEVVPDCDTMFSDVETLMDSAPGLCAQVL